MARTVVISNSKLNRYGFRMLTAGALLEHFKRNPIMLFMHNRPWRGTKDEILPLGTVQNLKIEDDDILGDLEFDLKDEFAAKIAQKWDDGIYKMVSVGATVIEYSTDPSVLLPGQTRATATKWILDEVSVVDMGANDDAIAIKNTKGEYITLKDGANLDFIPIIENKPKMKKIALKYGLPEDATEEQILDAIEKERLANKTLKEESEKQTLAAITSAVDAAIKKNPTLSAQRQHLIDQGKAVGLESLNVTLSLMEPAVKPMDIITLGKKPDGGEKKLSDLTSEEIAQLKSENVEQYKLMYRTEYGCEPKL